jgi:hypothetical protein
MATTTTTSRINVNGIKGGAKGKDSFLPEFEVDPQSCEYIPEEQYPEVEIGRGLTAQLMWITPALASEWVAQVGKKQRSKRKHHLQSLKEDLLAGRFRLNGETIIFDWDGFLINGQHRLTAVIETGKPIISVVIRNVPPTSYITLDNAAKRRGSDALQSSGYLNSVSLSAAAVLFRRYERKMLDGMGARGNLVLSSIAVEQTVKEHPGLADSVAATFVCYRVCGYHSAIALCHYILSGIDASAAKDFFYKLETGEELKKGSPILALRNRARERDYSNDDLVLLIFKTWNSWRKDRHVLQLKKVQGEQMPIPK